LKRRSKKKKISLSANREMIKFKKINTSTERLYQKATNSSNINIYNMLKNNGVNFYDVLLKPNNYGYQKFNNIKSNKNQVLKRYYYLGVGFIC